mgnify:CR=1 FL=1
MLFNDATANQENIYPYIKFLIVSMDLGGLASLFSIPMLANLITYMTKFYGVLEKSKAEYWK